MYCPLMLRSRTIRGEHNDVMAYENEQCLKANCAWWLESRNCCPIKEMGEVAGQIIEWNAIKNLVQRQPMVKYKGGTDKMICKRCGTGGFARDGNYCLHCQIAVDIEEAIGKKLADAGVDEGFPDWQKPIMPST